MRRTSLITTFIFAGALAFAMPAFAQRGGGHGGGGGHAGGGARAGAPAGGGMRMGGGGVRMGGGGMRMGGGFAGPRGTVRGPYVGSGFYRGGAYYRGGGYYRGGFYGTGYYGAGRYWGGHYWNVAPIHYYRPYYTFHPYFNLGFGLWAGYSVPWAYPYYYPYAYPYPYPYSAAAPGYSVTPPVTVNPDTNAAPETANGQPDQSNLGGMSFEITPSDAQVFVDGNYVGTVGQFTATSQPLGVPAGRHRVEIRLNGYKTMAFDADIVAGQVVPYQGQMER